MLLQSTLPKWLLELEIIFKILKELKATSSQEESNLSVNAGNMYLLTFYDIKVVKAGICRFQSAEKLTNGCFCFRTISNYSILAPDVIATAHFNEFSEQADCANRP